MYRSSSFWFGRPKEEASAAERAAQSARRETRLEQYMLQGRHELADGSPRPGGRASRVPTRNEQRDPHELKAGLDVQELSESTYDRLFSHNDGVEDTDT